MTVSRYAEALAPTVAWLKLERSGWGVVVSPPSQQRELAAYLASKMPDRPAIELGASTSADWFSALIANTSVGHTGGAFVTLAPNLDESACTTVLAMLNGQRDRTSHRGVWVLIVSPRELTHVRRHAPDLASTFRSFQAVPFIPQPMNAGEIERARAELHAEYRRRFGRLDLRGFVRSEHEDVSFAVEEVFQPLAATVTAIDPERQLAFGPPMTRQSLVSLLSTFRLHHFLGTSMVTPIEERAALITGAPGSGKSFFLRWCALTGSRDVNLLEIERPVPIHVPLAATAVASTSEDLEVELVTALLEAGLDIAHVFASEATAGRVLFLFDGLDEIGTRRAAMMERIAALLRRYPASMAIVTSRPAGVGELPFGVVRLDLQPLDDNVVRALLARWCELYEIERAGPDGAVNGRAEGEALASQVLASPVLADLARFPLLATIIAIVHRAGVRLPDHRVELYDHITRILVERWNQLRSRDAAPGPVIRVADAIRLLGPVAYDMVASGRDGAIDEDSLRDLLTRQLRRGAIRVVVDADEAITVFRNALGLLVEQSPGVYGFLHKTLGEFLAAQDVVRTGALERLLEPATCFDPRWREVILLALGIVGQLQADDDRVHRAVSIIFANRLRPDAPDHAPELLASIVADDPALTAELAGALCRDLIATWQDIRIPFEHLLALSDATARVLDGPWATTLAAELRESFRDGLGPHRHDAHRDWRAELLIPLLVRTGLPRATLECDLIARWLVQDALDSGEHLTRHGPWWFTSVTHSTESTFEVDLSQDSAIASIIRCGGAEMFAVGVFDADAEQISYLPDALRERGGRFVVAEVPPSDPTVVIAVAGLPAERFDAVFEILLESWRELDRRTPGGPPPPRSVSDAVARFS